MAKIKETVGPSPHARPTAQKEAKRDEPFGSDAEIAEMVEQFEQARWPYERWTHRAHLAVGVWYLLQFSFDEALDRVRRNIPRYNATSGGPPDGYHDTITVFFMTRLRKLMRQPESRSAAEWVEYVLPKCGMDCLLKVYTPEVLWSPAARAGWVEPDRAKSGSTRKV